MEENINSRSGSEDVSLKEIIYALNEWYKYLLSKWMIIIIFGGVGAITGFLYAARKQPSYTATTTFVLESGDKTGAMGQYAGIASMVGIDLNGGGGGGIFQGDNLPELYKSRTMIEKTLLSPLEGHPEMLLIDRYILINKLREKWATKQPKIASISFKPDNQNNHVQARIKDSIITAIAADINQNYLVVSKPDKKLSIIKVDVKSSDEYFAKAFNDQIVYNVNEFYILTKTKKSLNNVNILQHKTDSVKSVMNGAIYTAAAVADETPNLNPTRQVQRVAPMQRSQFTAESNKTVLALLIQNLEMSKMSLLQETPLIQVVDKPVFPLEKYKLSRAKAMIIGCLAMGFLTAVILLLKKILSTSLD